MNLDLKILFLSVLLVSEAFGADPELQDSQNRVQDDKKIEKAKEGYKDKLTFTYQELRDEVEDEVLKENERRYLKALENKLAKLGLKEGDPGYDDVDVDCEEVENTPLDTDNIKPFGQDEEKLKDEEKGFDQSLKKLLRGHLRDHFDRGLPDVMAESMLDGLHDLLVVNGNSAINEEERKLALKYKGRKYEPTLEEIKKIEDLRSNRKISLSKVRKLQKEAYDVMMDDDVQVDEYNREKNWERSRSHSKLF